MRRLGNGAILFGLLVAFWQHQAIIDWWTLRNYEVPAEIAVFADQTTMTDEARRIFYASEPALNDKTEFATSCPVGELRQSLVLGCYGQGDIFILRVEREELKSVMPLTAAHEMLHAAYKRLSASERESVNKLIETFYPQVDDVDFSQVVEEYKRSEPKRLLDELHSLLGTEIEKLSPELEAYYRKFFKDRAQVVAAFKAYQGVFADLNRKRESLLAEIENLKQQIERLDSEAAQAAAEADSLSQQIQDLRAQGRVEESNELVPAQNRAAQRANSLNQQIHDFVRLHNQKVDEVNQLAILQNDLVNSLDAEKIISD